jgi:hypothetical protein
MRKPPSNLTTPTHGVTIQDLTQQVRDSADEAARKTKDALARSRVLLERNGKARRRGKAPKDKGGEPSDT